ncbi:MAG: DUF4040 domain-containing protein [Planctomycetes bacterium]|nr:DUF4040 domain-containing protein [Planctomycetota bacterium]
MGELEALDLLLGLALVALAWRLLAAPDLFEGIVLFVTFGLLLSFAWVRLGAPDVALAEAAIGAGLTGALLLDARGAMPGASVEGPARLRWPVAVLAAATGGVLVAAVLTLPAAPAGLEGAVAARLEESGVAHPVTAVLLNFRGYDTLLELGVLWLAWLAVAAAGPRPDPRPELRPDLRAEAPTGPVLAALVSQLVPLLILVGAYLLWAGAHAPGGAFQAGAILAGGGVLLRLSGVPLPEAARAAPVVGLGFALFLGVGLAQAAAGRRFLELLPAQAHDLLVLVEVAATVSIAAVLAALFAGRRSVS